MKVLNLLLLSVSLAMDAFSVSLCKGLKLKQNLIKYAMIVAAFFGVAQALMPLLGWLLSRGIIVYVQKFGPYIAFGILAVIGVKMIIDAVRGEEDNVSDKLDIKELILLAVATSIDALAVGVTFSIDPEQINVFISCTVIGAVTFAICVAGVLIGHKFGDRFGKPASIIGGCVLILIGVRIMLEGMGIL